MSALQRLSQMNEPLYKRKALQFEPVLGKRVETIISGTIAVRAIGGHQLTCFQTQQCRKAIIPLHAWRTNTFWADRMSQAISIFPIFGQAIRLLGNDVIIR